MSMVPDAHSQMLVRVSDTDREGVIARLRDGYAEGRLTFNEFSDRVDQVLAARTGADLAIVTNDLPVAATAEPPVVGESGTRWLPAVLSSNSETGRWPVGPQNIALALMGTCRLDLREAQFHAREILIDAVALLGSIDVIVPEGMDVQFEGLALLASKSCRVPHLPAVAGIPRLRVRAFAFCGAVRVRTKQPWSKRVDAMLDWLDGRFLGR